MKILFKKKTHLCLKKTFLGVILSLLSHHLVEIKQEMYALCQQKVTAAVGPKLNVKKVDAPAKQIVFLLEPEILIEIAFNGLTSENYKVNNLLFSSAILF